MYLISFQNILIIQLFFPSFNPPHYLVKIVVKICIQNVMERKIEVEKKKLLKQNMMLLFQGRYILSAVL